jgi:hypothetical protein
MRENMSNGLGWVDKGPRHMSSFERSYAFGARAFATEESKGERRPIGYNRPAADEPYLEALRAFIEERISRMEPKPRQDLSIAKQHLHDIMHDQRSLRDLAAERGVSFQALSQGRKDAIEQLVKDDRSKFAAELRWYLATVSEDVVSRLPGWVR